MKNEIIKASEELFPIKAEMSLDEQSDQLLRQIGFKFGANWAIEKAYNWLVNAIWNDDIYGLGTNGNENNVSELLRDFKQAMKGCENGRANEINN